MILAAEKSFLMDKVPILLISYILAGGLTRLGTVFCEIQTDLMTSIKDRNSGDVVSNCQKSTTIKCINQCVTYESRCRAVSYKRSEGICLLHSTHPLSSNAQVTFSSGFRLYYSEQGDCDDGWEKFGGSCYLFNINPLSWEQAKTTCTDLGSNLLKVEDAAENEFAKAKCAEYGAYYYWIGARYYAQYGEYRWYDGTAIIYNDWSQGQPDTINGCVDLLDHFDWKWNDHSDCFTTYGGSICEKECDVGWGKFDGRCYKFNTNLLSWEQAKVTCTDLGANLLKVEDATENDFARAKCAEYGATHYWIGARYYAQFGEYRWYDGTTISYNDWYPGEPDIISGCVDMLDIYNWHWNDHPDCSTSYGGSICEKGLFD